MPSPVQARRRGKRMEDGPDGVRMVAERFSNAEIARRLHPDRDDPHDLHVADSGGAGLRNRLQTALLVGDAGPRA